MEADLQQRHTQATHILTLTVVFGQMDLDSLLGYEFWYFLNYEYKILTINLGGMLYSFSQQAQLYFLLLTNFV